MAKKFQYKDSGGVTWAAYQEGPLAIYKAENGWKVAHIQTGDDIMGFAPFDQKRDALAYAQELLEHDLDWDFSSKEEMMTKNPEILKARDYARGKV